jgi:SAM-dependent methyltransferase
MVSVRCKICRSPSAPLIEGIFDDRHGYPGRFDIHRCTKCGFCQTIPEIPSDRIGEIYTQYYPRKTFINIDEISTNTAAIASPGRRWMMGINNTAHYHVRKGTKVLDVGCGDCTSIRELAGIGVDAYGIEPDQNIKAVVEKLGLNVHIGLFHETPYPDGFFDYITMSQVLEHIHNPEELLTSFRRILKDDGKLIIGVPNVDSRLKKKYNKKWLNWHVPYHINHFSRNSLHLLAGKCGFRVVSLRTYTPNLWVDLQVKLANYPVREGIRVPFFNGEPEPTDTRHEETAQSRLSKVIRPLSRMIDRIRFMRILYLRMVDALGLGESYLIFLEKMK